MTCPKTKELINELTGDLSSCCPVMANPTLRLLPWALFSLLYVGGVVLILGIREDIALKLKEPEYLFEMILAGFVTVTASLSSAWLSIPDMCGKRWVAALPLTGAGALILWQAVNVLTGNTGVVHFDHCLEGGLLLAALPAAMLIYLMRKGATCAPRLMASMNILAVAGLAFIAMKLVCAVDTAFHAGLIQIIPFIIAGFIMGLAARKIYRW